MRSKAGGAFFSPVEERQQALNWRLDTDVSTGLIGEVGLVHLDTGFWVLNELPNAVTGFGQIMAWDDGREVPDTVQAVFRISKSVASDL